jgi:predicted lipoprotein with Yx(FWY)xxD motif
MKPLSKLFNGCLLLLVLIFVISCKDDDNLPPDVDASGEVQLATNATFGAILADGNGTTLYYFTRDVSGVSACAGGCLNTWPVYYSENLTTGTGLNTADFGTITRDDGTMQTTYKGWPLYYYSSTSDGIIEAEGATGGQGVNNVWYVVKPTYSLMIADAQLAGHDGKNYKSDYTEGDGVTKYFTDAMGRTLYIFKNDTKDTNNFTNGDATHDAIWPIFYVELEDLPSAMDIDDFGEITVLGQQQLTYKGWPLYYFGQDAQRGENKGISFPAPAVWPIANFDTAEAQ